MKETRNITSVLFYIIMTLLAVFFILPIALVVMNSFKNKLYISTTPFAFPDAESYVNIKNYVKCIKFKLELGQLL